jgi:CheY-like chemotaxis protein
MSAIRGIQLRIMDGYEGTREIKADPVLRSTPTFAITSYALGGKNKRRRRRL